MTLSNQDSLEADLRGLLGRIAEGEESAIEAFYAATSRRVFGLTLKILGVREAAEEATLDVYTQVWRSAETYDAGRGSPLAWLLTLSRTRAIDHLRSKGKNPSGEDFLEHAAELTDPLAGPADKAGASERALRVREALDMISTEQRQALTAAFFGGLSHSQISSALNLPLGTVKRRIRNGLARLRDLLASHQEGLA
jgi:RNA polymerase sigma-70 factor (ECF subfamily)